MMSPTWAVLGDRRGVQTGPGVLIEIEIVDRFDFFVVLSIMIDNMSAIT